MLLGPGWHSGAAALYVLYNCNTFAEMDQVYIKRAQLSSKIHHMQTL